MKLTARTLSALAATLVSLGAHAASPGARNIDQMVNLVANTSSPACPVYGYAVNQQINADGSLSPFSIPDGYALVITGLDWFNHTKGNTNAVARFEARLSVQGGSTAVIFTDFAANSGQLFQGGSAQGISDVTVKPGVSLCYGHSDWTTTASIIDIRVNVHGYLTKDRGSRGDDEGNNEEFAGGRRSR